MVNYKLISGIFTSIIFVFFACKENKEVNNSLELNTKTEFTPVLLVHEIASKNDQFNYFKLEIIGKSISSRVNGQLEKGEIPFEVGTKFKKNDLLFQINNSEAFQQLISEKKVIVKKLNELTPQININNREDYESIQNYAQNIYKSVLINDLPKLANANEDLLKKNGVYNRITNVKKMELNMENYFILAPFDGQILSINYRLNTNVSKNKVILKIGQKAKYKLKMPEGCSEFKLEVYNFEGEKIGIAKKAVQQFYDFVPNKQFNSLEQIVKIKSNFKVNNIKFFVPKSALKNNEISILENNKVLHKKIEITEKTVDGYWISGVKKNDLILVTFK